MRNSPPSVLWGRNRIWVAVTSLLVLVGSVGAVWGANALAHSKAEEARLAFHLSSAEIASTMKLAIQHEEDLVISTSAFVTGNPNASPAAFDRWIGSVHAMTRFPELQNIGLVAPVSETQLGAFKKRIAADPVRPLGPRSLGAIGAFQVLPGGRRPLYCFAVSGLARSAESYLPAGLDYCALAPALIKGRDSGLASYAPFVNGNMRTLGVETPVYRGGVVPPTVSSRRREFIGWLGELLLPKLVLGRSLEGHPGIAVRFSFKSPSSRVAFTSGRAPAGGLSTMIPLHNGWTVQTYGPAVAAGVFASPQALIPLAGGILLALMFGLLVLVLGTGRRRALALVREKTRELSHQAQHDPLTGLPNRALVLDRANQMLARTARHGTLAGALFIDIDGFKAVNDSHGHGAGDELLRTVAERMEGALRAEDTVGRLGGDEFVVLVEPAQESMLNLLADHLTAVLRQPVALTEGRAMVFVTASIGIALGRYPSADALLREADLALYAAKAAGKDRYSLFQAGEDTRLATGERPLTSRSA